MNLSAYRIVQEALSNAMRHAPGSTVQVRLFYGEDVLVIEIRNDGGRTTPAPGRTGARAVDWLGRRRAWHHRHA